MEEYKKLLQQLVQFKSISTDPEYANEIEKCLEWLKSLLLENHFKVEIIKGFSNPIIYAEYIVSDTAETALVYGHYDVQPAEKDEGWFGDPFELLEKNGRLYARGAIDNKGQLLIHLVSIFKLIREQKLKYNVKVLIEGSEEVGSVMIDKFIEAHKDKLASDFIVVSDSAMLANRPTIEAGMRGVINLGIKLSTSDRELHSGLFGGVLPNASHELVKLMSTLWDENNKVLIDNFYDGIDEIPEEIKSREIKSDQAILDLTGYKKITKPFSDIEFFTHAGLIPSIEVTALKSGYIQEGFKNSIPYTAEAKINIRVVESQEPGKLLEDVKDFIDKHKPEYSSVEFYIDAILPAVKVDIENKYVKKTKNLLEKIYNEKVEIDYSGGSLPLIKYFKDILDTPMVLTGLANEDSNMHGANENFDINFVQKGLNFSYEFFSN